MHVTDCDKADIFMASSETRCLSFFGIACCFGIMIGFLGCATNNWSKPLFSDNNIRQQATQSGADAEAAMPLRQQWKCVLEFWFWRNVRQRLDGTRDRKEPWFLRRSLRYTVAFRLVVKQVPLPELAALGPAYGWTIILTCHQLCSFDREVTQHAVGAGTFKAQQTFHHHIVFAKPSVLAGRH